MTRLAIQRRFLSTSATIALIVAAVPASAEECFEALAPQPEECSRSNADIVVVMPAGENTERISTPAGTGFSSTGFSISIDNETIAGAPAPADPRRPTDIRTAASNVDIRFDGLDKRRFLNVATEDLRASYRAGEAIGFRTSANYPRYIARSEIRVRDRSRPGRPVVAVLSAPPNGQVLWAMPKNGSDEFEYVLRVYDARGRYDETAPLTLNRTTRYFEAHETVRGNNIAPGEGQDRTAIRNIPIRGGLVTASAEALTPGARVQVMGEEVTVDPSGAFVISRILPVGEHAVDVEISDANGTKRIVRDVEIPARDWFRVGIADLTFGKRFDDDLAEADPDYEDTYANGRLGYFGTGYLANGTRLTVSVDTGNGDIEDVFDRLDDKDPRKVLQRLDESDFYPTYGDDSTAFDAAPTSGRFYLELERGGTRLTWGDFRVGIEGPEFLTGTRTLYGAELKYVSPATTSEGDARTRVTAYAAQPDTLPQRDILRGTGGSAYFLSRQDINYASETVSVQIRDPNTGRIIDTTYLVEGVGYDIDYIQGVIILAGPLTSSVSDGGLVSRGSSGEYDVNLVVQYEYTPTTLDVDGASTGGRIERWVTDDVRLGLTAMQENTDTADQNMIGADLRWRLGEESYFAGEIAQTDGPGFGRSISTNGGLTIDATGPGSGSRASAYRLDSHLVFADLGFRLPGFLDVYYEQKEAGFETLNEDTPEDQDIFGFELEVELNSRLLLGVDAEYFRTDSGDEENSIEAGLSYALDDKWTLSGAVEHVDAWVPFVPNETGERTDAVVRLDYEPSDDLLVYGFAQRTLDLSGGLDRNDRAGLGIDVALSEKVDFAAEISGGSDGPGADVHLNYRPTADNEVYLGYTLDPNRTAPTSYLDESVESGSFILGGRVRHSENLVSFAEDNWDLWGDQRSISRTYGVTYTPDARWSVSGGLENGVVRDDINGDFDRIAVSMGVGYASEERIDGRLRLEYRVEDGVGVAQDRETWAVLGGLSYRVSDDWRAIFGVDALISESDQTSFLDGEYVEANLGYAYRPVDNERLNMLFRYAYLYDLPGPDQVTIEGSTNGPLQKSHVLSADADYDLSPKLSVGGKYGYRKSKIAPRATRIYSDATAHLGVLRFDWHVIHKWDAFGEGRTLVSKESDISDYGALLGVYRHVGNNLKVGLGYEWGQVSDNPADIDYLGQGVFLNLVGKF